MYPQIRNGSVKECEVEMVGEGLRGVVWILSASWACVVDGWKVVTPVED